MVIIYVLKFKDNINYCSSRINAALWKWMGDDNTVDEKKTQYDGGYT